VPHADMPRARPSGRPLGGVRDPLHSWIGPVRASQQPCLALNRDGQIAACSLAAVAVLGLADPLSVVGRDLLGAMASPIGFTGGGDKLSDWELGQIPPLRSLRTGRLARSVLRIRGAHTIRTLDAVATPLYHESLVIGSLTFFQEL